MSILRSINRFILISLALLGLSISSAESALVDLGDNTLDDSTGLKWLDLSLTTGMSYNDVLASAYVTNDGYRYATESEVSVLFTNAGGVPTQSPAFSPGNLAASQLLLSLMGCTSYLVGVPCDGTDEWSPGMWGDTADRIALIEALIRPPTFADGLLATRWVQVAGPDAVFRADVASFLVMPSAVPVPAAVWLFGTALIGFVGMSRRRKVA